MQLELIDSKDEKKKKKTRKNEQTWDDHCTKDFGTPTSLAKQLGSLATNMGGNIYIYKISNHNWSEKNWGNWEKSRQKYLRRMSGEGRDGEDHMALQRYTARW